MSTMRILVTNDDGWDAPGLELLQRVAAEFGQVYSVAPLEKRSGCGHQLTFHRPISFELCSRDDCWSVDGMPADCVRLGLSRLGPFDWVLSGVNDGANLGVDTFISGTVAAAREAMMLGIPSIAISQYRKRISHSFDWDQATSSLRVVLASLLDRELPAERFWNVNLPDLSEAGTSQVPAIAFCETDPSPLPMDYQHNGSLSTYSGTYQERTRVAGRDVATCFSGRISITML